MVDHERNRQPTAVLVRWLNGLGIRSQAGNAQFLTTKATMHVAFQDGQTLLALLKRIAPEAEAELSIDVHKRCLSEAATLHNLERGLNFVWRSNPSARNMPTAPKLYAGHTGREAVLRFVDELFAVYVERPARRHAAAVLSWADRSLRAYGRGLSGPSLAPPFRTLAADCETGVSLGCLLHHAAQLGSGEPPDLNSFYWEPCAHAELEANLEQVQPRLAARGPARDMAASVAGPDSYQLLLVQLHALWLACAGTLPVVRWCALVRYRDHDRLLQRYADQLEAACAHAEAQDLSAGLCDDAHADEFSTRAGRRSSEHYTSGASSEDEDESPHANGFGVRSPIAWDDDINDDADADWLGAALRSSPPAPGLPQQRDLSGSPRALALGAVSVWSANLATAPEAWAASLRASDSAAPPSTSQQRADRPRLVASAMQPPWRANATRNRARSPRSPQRRQQLSGFPCRGDGATQPVEVSGPAEWLLESVQLLVCDRPVCIRSRGLTTTADFSLGNECVPTAEASLGRMMPVRAPSPCRPRAPLVSLARAPTRCAPLSIARSCFGPGAQMATTGAADRQHPALYSAGGARAPPRALFAPGHGMRAAPGRIQCCDY
jgi:hypothetical protein